MIAEGVKKTFRCQLFPQLLLPLHISKLYPSDLTRNRLGQCIDKLNFTWILVWRCDSLDMLLQLGRQFRRGYIARSENNVCFDDLAAHLIGAGDDRRFCDGGMFFQRTFYFKWADTITRADNYIIGSTYEPEVAILVLKGAVASNIPITANAGLRCVWITPVFFEQPGWTLWLHLYSNIAFLVGRKWIAVVVNHLDLEARSGFAHRTRFDCQRWEVGAQYHRLRLPVAIANGHTRHFLPDFDHFRVKWLARACAVA